MQRRLRRIDCPKCEAANTPESRSCRRCAAPLGGSAQAPMDTLHAAERWRRLAAWIVDLPISPASFAAGMLAADRGGLAVVTLALLLLGIVGVPTQVVLLARHGQTVGKRLFGIRIVDEETGATGAVFSNVVLRYFINWLLTLIPPYFAIDHFFIFARNRRCLHDYLAGTKVVLDSPRA